MQKKPDYQRIAVPNNCSVASRSCCCTCRRALAERLLRRIWHSIAVPLCTILAHHAGAEGWGAMAELACRCRGEGEVAQEADQAVVAAAGLLRPHFRRAGRRGSGPTTGRTVRPDQRHARAGRTDCWSTATPSVPMTSPTIWCVRRRTRRWRSWRGSPGGTLDHRRYVQDGQGAGRAGPLRGAQLAGLVLCTSSSRPRMAAASMPRAR